MEFIQKIKEFSLKFHMFYPGMGVLVGLSGGADSVALLEVLCQMRAEFGLRLYAVHIHHGIREAADKDVKFCESLCAQKKVPFSCEKVDVPLLAEKEGMSIEEAGRKARYDVFENYRQKENLDVIAVAHHKNDQAETMLFQLFRGSGLRGLSGIPYKREHIVRPLLAVTRKEIEAFMQKEGLLFVTDETNGSDAYTRNKIRRHILPVAEDISAGAIENMNRTATLLWETQDFMEKESTCFLEQYARCEEEQIAIPVNRLKEKHIALQKYIICSAIEQLIKNRKNITERHVESILSLLEKEGEKNVDLPAFLFAKKQYDVLLLGRKEDAQSDGEKVHIPIASEGTYRLPDGKILCTKLLTHYNLENIPKSNCMKWFDYDKITHNLSVRTRHVGDYLHIDENGAKKLLQDYLVNEKVPKSKRDDALVLADGQHIVWVLGKRISAHYKVSDKTKHILQISVGETEDERKD